MIHITELAEKPRILPHLKPECLLEIVPFLKLPTTQTRSDFFGDEADTTLVNPLLADLVPLAECDAASSPNLFCQTRSRKSEPPCALCGRGAATA